jgi:hypothetical protein
MQWALHIHRLDQLIHSDSPYSWPTRYQNAKDCPINELPPHFEYIYIGDEFCPNRLPSPKELKQVLQFTKENKQSLILVTPMLSDEAIEKCHPLFDALSLNDPESEIVVNDWGLMSFLRENYPHLKIALGRLLNKGFKDPRLQNNDISSENDIYDLLNQYTYQSDFFQEFAISSNINRLEQDLLPYEDLKTLQQRIPEGHVQNRSYYLPYGYVTTGRICWTSLFCSENNHSKAFLPCPPHCQHPCAHFTIDLCNPKFQSHLYQNGNTIFYLYSPKMCNDLIDQTHKTDHRLVYQGLLV